MKLYLVRHGKTKGNQERRYIGRTDESLCQEGITQIQQRVAEGRYAGMEKTEFLFVSPMKRCIETAGLLLPEKEAIPIPAFREIDFGAFEGKNYQELSGNADYQAWLDSNGEMTFPNGESRAELIQRCQKGMEQVAAQMKNLAFENTVITLVVHGGTIMSLLSTLGDEGRDYYDYQCKNGSGYLCEFLPEKQRSFVVLKKIN